MDKNTANKVNQPTMANRRAVRLKLNEIANKPINETKLIRPATSLDGICLRGSVKSRMRADATSSVSKSQNKTNSKDR